MTTWADEYVTMLEDAKTCEAVGPRVDRGVMRPVEVGTVAALFVEPNGCYVGVPGVDQRGELK